MAPEKGTFKIQTVGPMNSGTSKKGNPWRSFDLQFEGDANWYNTFWMDKEDPQEGRELTGTKSYDDQFKKYKFETERTGGKTNWNPAGAQATVMLAAVEIVNGFLSLGNHYELWEKGDIALKEKFTKYVATVEAASKQMKERVVAMGSLQQEQKVDDKQPSAGNGDPGPTPPPDIPGWPEGQEPVDV